MLQSDSQIHALNELGNMIDPFFETLQEQIVVNGKITPCLSYGLSSYGYDIRLSDREFKVFRHLPGKIVDPKRFDPDHLSSSPLCSGDNGSYFVIPGNSYGLGVSLEKFKIPKYVTVICLGKTTYARVGLIANITPAEAEWEGHLTLEFSNSSNADCRIYANEGVVQLLFFRGEPPVNTYKSRQGKYQSQGHEIVLPKIQPKEKLC